MIAHYARRPARAPFFSGIKNRFKNLKRGEIWRYVWTVGIAVFFAGSVAGIGLFAWIAKDLPDPENIGARRIAQTTTIYDRTGETVLYQIHGEQKRTSVTLEQISEHVMHATLAAEDRNFYNHSGLDPKGMLRGLFRIVKSGGQTLQSGSTITQQFIKKSVLTDDQTPIRKAKEIVLALELERRYSKDKILTLYLNEIPYGNVSYGIQAAAESFLGKSAKDLTISESALLAALPNAPTRYSPYGSRTNLLIDRQQWIIDSMAEEGYITKEEAEEAKKDEVLTRIKPRREPIVAPHFVFYVRELLAEEFGEDAVEQGGLKVITTLDAKKQQIAEDAIAANLEKIQQWKANTAAMTAIDPKTGEVLAMVGSADYFDDEINGKYNAMLGRLQPGSSIKPMVYAASFERGYTPSTVVDDIKTNFSTGEKPYEPSNYDGSERGFVTLKEALAGSLNIPAVKVLYLTGLDAFQDFGRRVGYTTFEDKSRFGLALVLGGAEVRPIEHIAAFSAFAQEGIIHPTKAILKVEDSSGKVLLDETEPNAGKRVFEAEVARQINDILSDNAARAYVFGVNNYLTLGGRPVAAKTGTTNDFKDAWTVGYTPSLVAGVWVGESTGKQMKAGADGSKIAAPIWNTFMSKALAGTPTQSFTPPQSVVTGKPILDGAKNAQVMLKIDRVSGKLATELTPAEYVEERGYGVPHSILFFVDKNDPRGPQPEHPENDPQYALWEAAIAKWLDGKVFTNDPPPTEYDDVHVTENIPTITLISPGEGSVIATRTFRPSVSTYARRGVTKVEYFIDGESIGSGVYAPFDGPITVPNRYSKGFHTLTARAYDDVGNRGETSVTVNVTADAGPIGIRWYSPWDGQFISAGQFPFTVSFSLDDPKSIRMLRLVAKPFGGGETTIGSIESPTLPSFSFQWERLPAGRYDLTIEATLLSGEVRTESVPVNAQ